MLKLEATQKLKKLSINLLLKLSYKVETFPLEMSLALPLDQNFLNPSEFSHLYDDLQKIVSVKFHSKTHIS